MAGRPKKSTMYHPTIAQDAEFPHAGERVPRDAWRRGSRSATNCPEPMRSGLPANATRTTPQKAGMSAETAATQVSVKIETGVSLRQITIPGDAFMPLPLTDTELAMLHALAAPIAENRRPEFLGAVTTKLEAAGPAAIGLGALHRTARTVLRDFWDPPPDLRQGRLGPREPRRDDGD
jgi:hypothetical protein